MVGIRANDSGMRHLYTYLKRRVRGRKDWTALLSVTICWHERALYTSRKAYRDGLQDYLRIEGGLTLGDRTGSRSGSRQDFRALFEFCCYCASEREKAPFNAQ